MGQDPIISASLHSGHYLPSEIGHWIALSRQERIWFEEPWLAEWVMLTRNRIVLRRSRFAGDLERSPNKIIYNNHDADPGVRVWKTEPSEVIKRSIKKYYKSFYWEMEAYFSAIARQWKHFVVLNYHTVPSRITTAEKRRSHSLDRSPDILVEVGPLNDRTAWQPLIDAFLGDLDNGTLKGVPVKVIEVEQPSHGAFANWIHSHHGDSACVLTVNVPRFFQKVWKDEVDYPMLDELQNLFASTLPGILKHLPSDGH
ncbi:MAG: N-formylglutamate amidohydrolase [Magnetococcales bacterium]|nr:N-formylglutamate amidohydrolase [Magnetococcales bacterium]